MKYNALVKCTPNNGYIKTSRNAWVFNSSSIHARINRRIGLQNRGSLS